MNTHGRIPRVLGDFITYLVNTANYLFVSSTPPPPPGGSGAAIAATPVLLNWQRLNMLEQDANTWRAFMDEAAPLYLKYSDKREVRTLAIGDKLRDVIKRFITFAQPQLEAIAGWRGSTIDDLEVFRIRAGALRKTTRTRKEAPISDKPIFGMLALGGGDARVTVRPFHDSKRASKFVGSDLEFRYIVQIADIPRPVHVDELTQILISSKALFTLHTGTNASEKILFAACRWIDVQNPGRNGPWTSIQSLALS